MLKYIELNEDKQPVTTFDTIYSNLDKLENAGIKLNSKTVIVDFDAHNDEEQERLRGVIDYIYSRYPTFRVETKRGVHLYYRVPEKLIIKNWTNQKTVYGFNVDYKTGTKSQGVIKLKGLIRKTNKPVNTLKFTELPLLPMELYPLPKSKNNTLLCLADGDGRNDNLYKHLLCVKESRYGADLTDVADFINNYLFKDKMKESELTSTVESAINKESDNETYNGQPNDMILFAQFIADKYKVKLYHNQLYFLKDNKYITNDLLLLKQANEELHLKKSQDQELLHQLRKFSDYINSKAHTFSILINNGLIDNGEFIPLNTGVFTPFYLDVDYNPNAYDEHVDKFLNDITCNRLGLRETLEEIMGHILLVNKFPQNVFFLNGAGKNGKSTFVTMLSNFAKNLTSHISLSRFEDDTSILSLTGKLLNVSDDINSAYIEKSEKLKLMSAGNELDLRAIYSTPINFKNTATFILTANELPVFKDKSNGFYRRILIIPFDFTVKDRNADLDHLLSTPNAKSYILNLALSGLKRIIKNGYEMSTNDVIKSATEQYKLDTDSIYAYLQDYPDIDGKWFNNVYMAYETYCEENYIESVPRNVFSRKLKNYGYHVGKQERVDRNLINKAGRDRLIYKN